MSASPIPRPPGWHRKRYPYVWTLEDRRRAVQLACFTDAGDGLPVGIREAARRTDIPRSTIASWAQWELKKLGLLERWRDLQPLLRNRAGAPRGG